MSAQQPGIKFTVTEEGPTEMRLHRAILVYAGKGGGSFATVHDIATEPGGAATILPGRPMTAFAALRLARRLMKRREGGFIPVRPSYMQQLRALCDRHGILLIADEVQTGFARTGRMFAMEHYGVSPDLMTLAKSMAGGTTLSAVSGKQAIMDSPNPGGLGGTYAGNPLAVAAATGRRARSTSTAQSWPTNRSKRWSGPTGSASGWLGSVMAAVR